METGMGWGEYKWQGIAPTCMSQTSFSPSHLVYTPFKTHLIKDIRGIK